MQKKTAFVILFSTLLTAVYAQNFYGTTPAGSDTSSTSSQVMTNDQFRSTVDSLGKQTKTNLSNQVDNQLKGGTPVTPSPTVPAPGTATGTQPAAGNPPAPETAAPQEQQFAPPPPPGGMQGSAPPPPAGPPSAQPGGSQPYTGFGGTQPKQGGAAQGQGQQGNTSGGWNVGY